MKTTDDRLSKIEGMGAEAQSAIFFCSLPQHMVESRLKSSLLDEQFCATKQVFVAQPPIARRRLLDPTSPRGVDPFCLICTCPPPLARGILGAHWLRVS